MKFIITLFLISSSLILASQPIQRCHFDEVMQQYKNANPNFIEYQTNQKTRRHLPLVATIPVVVHIVYNTNEQNISNEQIYSQLDVLNKDYRKQNYDILNAPFIFNPLLADTEIEFCLASIDPNNNSTNGINRVQTNNQSFSIQTVDNVKSSLTGGADPWPRDSYLNIWVCELSGLLGMAYPPGIIESLDGVVVGHNYFGTTGTVESPYNLGRTATHEVGHWLNLKHLWGDFGCDSDYCSDTPIQEAPNYDCIGYPMISTCNNIDNSPHGDMFFNFMDYGDDDCLISFTINQTERMQDALLGPRASILSSSGCSGIPNCFIEGTIDMTLEIMTDNFPEETSWKLENTSGIKLYSDSMYTSSNSTYIYSLQVQNDECYTLTFFDSYGDGICCTQGSGYFKLYNQNGDELINGGAFFYENSYSIQVGSLNIIENTKKENPSLIKITDILGQEICKIGNNQIYFYIYNDGSVVKKIIR